MTNTKPFKNHRFNFVSFSLILVIILVLSSWVYIFKVDGADIFALFSEKNLLHTKKFINGMFGIGEANPAFKNIEEWKNVLKLTFETLNMSIMAIGFAAAGMFITVIPAAGNTANGSLTLSKRWYNWILYWIIRGIYIFSRSVPELVWAMVIIFILKPGILPGALALALHNFGILGKLCTEVVEDLDLRPVRNLASCGASKGQLLVYGVIPMVIPKFVTYIVYRWEVILRTTIVVGFVGAGGLGRQFKLSMSFFNYSQLTLILICYMLLVALADLISEIYRNS